MKYDKCRKCGGSRIKVIESTSLADHVRRRRKCKDCDHRITTYEVEGDYLQTLRQSHETLNEIRALLGGKDPRGLLRVTRSCNDCMYMEPEGCSMEFPEAGGDFAEECSLYTALS
jgi:hypothetical protein